MYFINTEKKFKVRYSLDKFMNFEKGAFDILNSYFLAELKNLDVYGVKRVQGESCNPAFLSYNIYRTTQYWWILLLYNDLMDVFQLEEGMEIRFPSTDNLEKLYFTLNSKQKQSELS